MTTRTTRKPVTPKPSPLTRIADDLRAALSSNTGPAWVQRRWAPDIDLVLQHDRTNNRWRLAATTIDRHAPAPETLYLLSLAFKAPNDDWRIETRQRKSPLGDYSTQVAEVTWTERPTP
jgi:hypothetical protein